jgi:hypothetical protein
VPLTLQDFQGGAVLVNCTVKSVVYVSFAAGAFAVVASSVPPLVVIWPAAYALLRAVVALAWRSLRAQRRSGCRHVVRDNLIDLPRGVRSRDTSPAGVSLQRCSPNRRGFITDPA